MEAVDHRLLMLQEMRSQNYDAIRFASYRTACKLRFVQKKANCKKLHSQEIFDEKQVF